MAAWKTVPVGPAKVMVSFVPERAVVTVKPMVYVAEAPAVVGDGLTVTPVTELAYAGDARPRVPAATSAAPTAAPQGFL